MKHSQKLKKQQSDILSKMEALTASGLTDETRAEFDDLSKQSEALTGDIARAESVEAQITQAEARTVADGQNVGAELQAFMAGDTSNLSDTVLAELDKQILILMNKTNPMRGLAHSVTTSSGIYEKLVSTSDIQASWVSETGARVPGTTTTLEKVTITAGELFASVPYTKRVLDMSAFDLAGWAQIEVAKAFASKERRAMFVDGSGVNDQPIGLLTHVETGAGVQKIKAVETAGVTADALIDLTYELETEYLSGATFVMSRQTAKGIRKLKDADGNYIWADGLNGNPATLLGYPITFVDEMPAATAGQLPVIFGNLNQCYTIVNHTTGTRLVRDELTAKPNVLLDSSRYCGGDVVNGQAVVVLKIAASK